MVNLLSRKLLRKLLLAVLVVGGVSPMLYSMDEPARIANFERLFSPAEDTMYREQYAALRDAIIAKDIDAINWWLDDLNPDIVRQYFGNHTAEEYATEYAQVYGVNGMEPVIELLRENNL